MSINNLFSDEYIWIYNIVGIKLYGSPSKQNYSLEEELSIDPCVSWNIGLNLQLEFSLDLRTLVEILDFLAYLIVLFYLY